MRTTFIGTSLSLWKNGALTHVDHTSSSWSADTVSSAVGNSSQYIGAIYSNDPVALRFDFFDSEGWDVEYHFVTGIGYYKNASYTGDLHVAYKNPAGGSSNTGTHWFDWASNDHDISYAYLR